MGQIPMLCFLNGIASQMGSLINIKHAMWLPTDCLFKQRDHSYNNTNHNSIIGLMGPISI